MPHVKQDLERVRALRIEVGGTANTLRETAATLAKERLAANERYSTVARESKRYDEAMAHLQKAFEILKELAEDEEARVRGNSVDRSPQQ